MRGNRTHDDGPRGSEADSDMEGEIVARFALTSYYGPGNRAGGLNARQAWDD
jgi:hypothetical protein